MLNLGVTAAIAALMCAVGAVDAQADDAVEIFDQLYGPQVKAAQSTRDAADDIELAARLLSAARSSTGTPNLLAVLCDHAYQLAARDPAGYDTAASAMQWLSDHVPARRAEAVANLVLMRRRAYLTARGSAKAEAGEALIEAMINQADLEATDDLDAAAGGLRQAMGGASAVRSPRLKAIRDRYEQLNARRLQQRRLAELRSRLKANPADQEAADNLMKLYVVEFDQPEQAQKYTFLLPDSDWARHVPLASVDPAKLTLQQASSLGDWYRGLAGGASSSDARIAMLRRAAAAYQQALTMNPDNPLQTQKLNLLVADVRDQLAKLGDSAPATIAAPTPTPLKPSPTTPADPTPATAIGHNIDKLDIDEDLDLADPKLPYVITGRINVTAENHIKIKVGPGVEIRGGSIELHSRGHLEIRGDPDHPAYLRHVTIHADLSGSFSAENAILENCSFHKNGAWFVHNGHSTKWTFKNCILHECDFPKITRTDYGVKFDNCLFTAMKLPPMAAPYRLAWQVVSGCIFAGCTVPTTFGWTTTQCNFYNCTFEADAKYGEKEDLTSEVYLSGFKGVPPPVAWAQTHDGAGKVTVNLAKEPFAFVKFRFKPPIAQLRKDVGLMRAMFE